jgi:hypothetical protein
MRNNCQYSVITSKMNTFLISLSMIPMATRVYTLPNTLLKKTSLYIVEDFKQRESSGWETLPGYITQRVTFNSLNLLY